MTLGWFLLGSMRVERDFQYAKAQLRPFTAPPYYVAEESLLVANVARLPSEPSGSGTSQLLAAGSVAALRSRLQPDARGILLGGCVHGARRAAVARRAEPSRARTARRPPRGLACRSGAGTVTVRVARRVRPVRAYGAHRDRRGAAHPARAGLDLQPARSSTSWHATRSGRLRSRRRARRLEREVRSVELLSSEEKLMAGLPNFATYFGRDMLMTALMMRPIWRPDDGGACHRERAAEALAPRRREPRGSARRPGDSGERRGVQRADGGVLRVDPTDGRGRRTAAKRRSATASRPRARAAPRPVRMAGLPPARARALLAELQRTRENYHMLDDEFQLPILEARYLADSSVPAGRKRRSCWRPRRAGRREARPRCCASWRWSRRRLSRTPATRRPANLISFVKRDSTHWRSASWRDSDAGYANGRFAMDINAIWVPRALEAIGRAFSRRSPPSGSAGRRSTRSPRTALRGPLRRATWPTRRRSARAIDDVARCAAALRRDARAARRSRARQRASWRGFPRPERAYWKAAMATQGGAPDSLAFLALSLDSAAGRSRW